MFLHIRLAGERRRDGAWANDYSGNEDCLQAIGAEMRMVISGRTEVFAVIGDPIGHTLSPAMQNAAFEHLNLDFVFLAFRVTSDELENAVRAVRALGIRGLNVTMQPKK